MAVVSNSADKQMLLRSDHVGESALPNWILENAEAPLPVQVNHARPFVSGYARPFTSGYASGESTGINRFLLSVLDPWQTTAAVPTFDTTDTHEKSFTYVRSQPVPASLSELYVMLPFALNSYKFLRFVATTPPIPVGWLFAEIIEPDLAPEEDYVRGRTVSAGLKIVSASQTGAIFPVSGVMSGLLFQQMPPLISTPFAQLSSFRNAESNAVRTALFSGIAAIAEPQGQYNIREFETPDVMNSGDMIEVTATADASFAVFDPGWTPLVNPSGPNQIIFDSDVALAAGVNFLPPNLYGQWKISLNMTFGGAVDNHAVIIRVFIHNALNPIAIVVDSPSFVCDNGNTASMSLRSSRLSNPVTPGPGPVQATLTRAHQEGIVTRVQVVVLSAVAAGSIYGSASITLQVPSANFENKMPGMLIAYQGAPATAQVMVTAVVNYELVPNAQLIRNVKTQNTTNYEPDDFIALKALWANRGATSVRGMYELPNYNQLTATQYFLMLAARNKSEYPGSQMHAAGLPAILLRLLGFIPKALGFLTPAINAADAAVNTFRDVHTQQRNNRRPKLTAQGIGAKTQMTYAMGYAAGSTRSNPSFPVPIAKYQLPEELQLTDDPWTNLTPFSGLPTESDRCALFASTDETGGMAMLHAIVTSALGDSRFKYTSYEFGGLTCFVDVDIHVNTAVATQFLHALRGTLAPVYFTLLGEAPVTGPSLGLALWASLRKLPHSAVLTGELDGELVLPISGVDAKYTVAVKNGLALVLPSANLIGSAFESSPKAIPIDNVTQLPYLLVLAASGKGDLARRAKRPLKNLTKTPTSITPDVAAQKILTAKRVDGQQDITPLLEQLLPLKEKKIARTAFERAAKAKFLVWDNAQLRARARSLSMKVPPALTRATKL